MGNGSIEEDPPVEHIIQWSHRYGDLVDEWGYALLPTMDGGYVLVGTTFNNDTEDYDAWLVKTDSTGEYQWAQVYGSYADEWIYTALPTMDGGYVLAGTVYPESFGLGGWDAWFVKTDAQGEYQWDQIYGGSTDDEVYAVLQATDGGFALVGSTIDTETGDHDAWLVKTDVNGDLQWDQVYGRSGDDRAWAVFEQADHGFILVGTTFNNDTGDYDAWLVKTDDQGEYQWDNVIGDYTNEWIYSALQTADGGYALAGSTFDNVTGNYDFWLVKVAADGEYQWDRSYGGSDDEEAYGVLQTADGGFVLTGYTDVSGTGIWNAWLVKTNSIGEMEWVQTFGDVGDNWAEAVHQTMDGEYTLFGAIYDEKTEDYDFWLMKTGLPSETTSLLPETTTESSPEIISTSPETPTESSPKTTSLPSTVEKSTKLTNPETKASDLFVPGMTSYIGFLALFSLVIWRKRH